MTTKFQAVKTLLKENWAESISGRANDVATPEYIQQQTVSQADLKTSDYVRIVEGGGTTFTPRGFGWTHQQVEADVTIEIRSATRRVDGIKTESHNRVFGYRGVDDDNVYGGGAYGNGIYGAEAVGRYPGLAGEVRRILDLYRKGWAEWCRIASSETRNESSAEGKNVHRADIDVALIQEAERIQPAANLNQ